jgi:hypothetical protein
MTHTPPSVHVDPHDIVGYIEATLPSAERARVEAHLSVCDDCTSELAAVSRLRRPARRPILHIGLAAAAAAVIALVLLTPRVQRPPADEPPVRGDEAAATAATVVTPADGAILEAAPVFAWRSLTGATAYRISVSRADGDSVWAATVRDTVVAIPAGVLRAGTDPYYWYVDVLLSDGRSLAGKPRQFRLGP